MLDIVQREAGQYGVHPDAGQLLQLARYHDLLLEWAPKVNLVGNATSETLQRRHILESIALGAALREREVLRPAALVLDVGSGAGFPGVVLRVVWPGIGFTLLEATAKKTSFLRAVVDDLGFDDVTVITARAEDAAREPDLRARFDLVVARAVAPLSSLVELTLPFARVGGRVVAPKGGRASAEVDAARTALETLGGRALLVPFRVPGPAQHLVVVVKLRETPPEYPRRSGVPARSPLGARKRI